MLLLYKQVDKSVLKDGFSIPVSYQKQFLSQLGFDLKRGEKRTIKLLLNGQEYEVKLINCRLPTQPASGAIIGGQAGP